MPFNTSETATNILNLINKGDLSWTTSVEKPLLNKDLGDLIKNRQPKPIQQYNCQTRTFTFQELQEPMSTSLYEIINDKNFNHEKIYENNYYNNAHPFQSIFNFQNSINVKPKQTKYSDYITTLKDYSILIESSSIVHKKDTYLNDVKIDKFADILKFDCYFYEYLKKLHNRYYIYCLIIIFYEYKEYTKSIHQFKPIHTPKKAFQPYIKAVKKLSELNDYFDESIKESLDKVLYTINTSLETTSKRYKLLYYSRWEKLLVHAGLNKNTTKKFFLDLEFYHQS